MSEQIQVLHVDDEPDFADLTATFLEREDDRFSIETAPSADEGLERLVENEYDCVVSDYDMPGKDGIEFLESVREKSGIPFILFTGKGSEEVASDAMSAGVTDYLQKRAGTEEYELLANRIENAIEARWDAERAERQEELMRLTEVAGNTGGFELDLETEDLILTDGARRLIDASEDEQFHLEDGIELYHPEERDRIREILEEAIETGEEANGTFRTVIGDEKRIWDVKVTPVTENGEVTKVRGAVNDVTDQRERQRELKKTETIFEHSQDSLFLFDVGEDFTVERVNPAYEEATGLSTEDVRGRKPRDDFGEDGAYMEQKYTECVEKEEPLKYDEQVCLDGELTHWETKIAPVVLNGEVEYIVGSTRDVTERKRREKELKRTQERLSLAVEAAGLGLWNWDVKSSEIKHNEQWAEMLGLPPEEGTVSAESIMERSHPERVSEVEEIITEIITGKREFYEIEIRLKTADGDWKWVRTVGQVAERDENGKATRLVGVNIDIDQLKRQKKEIERYKTFVESSSDVITHVDVDGTVLYQSPAVEDTFGYEQDELVGDNVFEYAHPDDRQKISEKFYAVLEDPERKSGKQEYRARDADGEYIWMEGVGKDQRDTEAGGVVINQRDISERKSREKQLERQNERLEEFASVVSHDLRNPLTVAKGRLELAQKDCDSEHLDDVEGALERMDALIEDILTLAQEGSDVGEMEVIETQEVLEDCWDNVETGTATLVNELEGKVEADPGRLKQVYENLVRNAVEYGGDDVIVTVGELDDRDGFYIADDGPGIPEEERKDVFETGYSTFEQGTGFGLSIVEEIVTAHGWDIEVTESKDGGARFEVSGVEMPDMA